MNDNIKIGKIDKKQLILNIAVPLGLGAVSSLITRSGMKEFATISQPPLTPPPFIFAIAWSVLYVLMGISSYRIRQFDKNKTKCALPLYALQLAFNLTWPFLFF